MPGDRELLQQALEDGFVCGASERHDYELPATVSSTIAIAYSADGHTFASTHGDHTVKVFIFSSGKQVANLKGHPRTPWTVKFHPLDSNIVASGCLGFEVSFIHRSMRLHFLKNIYIYICIYTIVRYAM